jgi:hypothetical protein
MKNGIFNGKPTIVIECSNCRAPLVEVIIVKDTDEENKVVAECCHCGDKSFQTIIRGSKIYASTEYNHSTPEFVLKARQFSDDPIERTGEVLVRTKKIKEWRRK